ncbi:unnamed protein product [Linum trigynum]|uniref:Uncharacterized protein n=1 Tax=Linum trigynum TaxID=586398 RepID=A0AAV2CH40_9ROSI
MIICIKRETAEAGSQQAWLEKNRWRWRCDVLEVGREYGSIPWRCEPAYLRTGRGVVGGQGEREMRGELPRQEDHEIGSDHAEWDHNKRKDQSFVVDEDCRGLEQEEKSDRD